MPKPLQLSVAQILNRARIAIKQTAPYKLGAGGMDPATQAPGGKAGDPCDCSGFIAWCLGMSRHTDHPFYQKYNGGWLETTAVTRDILLPQAGLFIRVAGLDWAVPGDVIVWGDKGKSQGHIGLISEVDGARVIHCSKGNQRATGSAIQETGPEIFVKNQALIGRYVGLVSS